jgi:multiple sugar transport system permease protein
MTRWEHIKAKYSTGYAWRGMAWKVTRAVLVIGICFLILYPIFLKVIVSLMEERDLYDATVTHIPKHITLYNYQFAMETMQFWRAFLNTFNLSLIVALLQVASCTLIAYGFARFEFPGKNILFGLVILTLIVPPQTISIPLFLSFRFFNPVGFITGDRAGINLLDSLWPYGLMAATGMGLKNGLYIFIIRQVFRGVPRELEESALVDGAGQLRTFAVIMLPSAVPIMVTAFLFSFVWQWTDSFYSSLFLQDFLVLPRQLEALPMMAGRRLGAELGTEFVLAPAFSAQLNNAATVLMIIPLIIIYVIAQRSFVESIERSGIVG